MIVLILFIISSQIFAENPDNISTDELISVSSAPEIGRYPLPSTSCRGLTFDGEFLWTGSYSDLYKINITDGSTVSTEYNSSRNYYSLSWGDDVLWATSSDYSKIIKINSSTFEEILSLDHPWSTANGLAWSVEGIYVYDNSIDKIYLLNDSTGLLIDSYDYYSDLGGIEEYDGFLWASRHYDEKIYKTTIDTGIQISHIDLDEPSMYLQGLTFENDNLWVIDDYSDSMIVYNVSGTADLVVYPDQDTYVNSRYGDEINGLSESIWIEDSYEAYLRFPLAQIEIISSAYLEIYQRWSNILDVEIYGVDSDLWDQLTMNWNNKLPVTTNEIDSVHILGENWYSIDVTDFINSQSDGWATFVIKTQSTSESLWFSSIESTSSKIAMLSINGTIYQSEMIPGPLTETIHYTVTDTETETETEFATTVTEISTFTEFYTTETETIWGTTITEINTENITEYLSNTDNAGIPFIFPASIFFVAIVLFRKKH